jgi:beta-galactosidase
LRELAGVWTEEIDALYPNPPQLMVAGPGNPLGLGGEHPVREYCERIHPEKARVLATYKSDFYAGEPCLTVNQVGPGRVYYLAARPAEDGFHDALAQALVREAGLARCLETGLPEGVTVQKRVGGGRTFLFLHNLKGHPQYLSLGKTRLKDVLEGRLLTGEVTLDPHASWVVEPA